jgi:ribosomal protein S27AE
MGYESAARMVPQAAPTAQRAEAARLEQRLREIEEEIVRLEGERAMTKQHLEDLRRRLTICPKCGRDRDFLADADGVLVHVLEDPEDTDLLEAGKPLFCPKCGEVFLYAGSRSRQPPIKAALRRR